MPRSTLTSLADAVAEHVHDGDIVALEGLWQHERGQFLRDAHGALTSLRIGGSLWQRLAGT